MKNIYSKNRILYIFRRIRKTSFSFLIFKLQEFVKKKIFRIFYGTKKIFGFSPKSNLSESSLSNFESVGEDIYDFLIASSVNNDWNEEACDRAREFLLTKKFHVLGYKEVFINKTINWHSDPIHDFKWEPVYFDTIDFVCINQKADVKVPWELSRFQYLLWLAEGYVLDLKNRPKYLELYESIFENWYTANPVGYGVNWIVSMEVAIRACNLAISFSVFIKDINPSLREKIITSLHEHLKFIDRFPEYSDVSGNHYLSNLMGKSILCFFLYGNSSNEFKQALNLFYNEAANQFEDDGCHFERAPIYHRLCLDMVALVICFDQRGGKCNQIGMELLHKGINFCNAISSSKGLLPVIGDSDSGHILFFNQDSRNFLGLQSLIHGLNLNFISKGLKDSNIIWHLAISKKHNVLNDSIDESFYNKSTVYDLSGFIAGHDPYLDCIMRVGPQGLNGLASHDHDDALSIWVYFNGQDFIVEKGCHSYSLDKNIRENDIGSLAHNLIQPINQNRTKSRTGSILQTAFQAPTAKVWSAKKRGLGYKLVAELDEQKDKEKIFSFYKRELISCGSKPLILTVVDSWEWCSSNQDSELRWHFAPKVNVNVSTNSKNSIILSDLQGGIKCELEFSCPKEIILNIDDYEHSSKYGKVENGKRVRVLIKSHKECQIQSKFLFRDT